LASGSKRPLSEAAPPAPTRTQTTDTRSKVARRRVIAGIVVAVLVVGAAAFLLTREGGITIPGVTSSGPDTPTLAFDRVKVIAESTTDTSSKQIHADPVGHQVQELVTALYQSVWIDPDVWEDGDYTDAFEDAMTESAASEASTAKAIESLTLGAAAGDTYVFVTPERSTLVVRVLGGPDDAPVQALAQVVFRASAEHTDGTFTDITQTASYFVQQLDGEWRIISFRADRDEDEAKTPVSATPTTEAS
jgi:hypothetical protein